MRPHLESSVSSSPADLSLDIGGVGVSAVSGGDRPSLRAKLLAEGADRETGVREGEELAQGHTASWWQI